MDHHLETARLPTKTGKWKAKQEFLGSAKVGHYK
jgi:hypothetical protein